MRVLVLLSYLVVIDATPNFSAFKWDFFRQMYARVGAFSQSKQWDILSVLVPCPVLTAFVCLFAHLVKIHNDDISTS